MTNYELDIRSASKDISANYLNETHLTAVSVEVANKAKSFAISDNVEVRKHFCEID